jgi:8-oxo-dGTP pyrophosphatase MutT (NUDIX family)
MPAVATQGTADASGSGTKKVGAKDASKAQTKGRRKDSPGARRATDRKASRGPRTPTVKEVSAGGVVYRRDDGQLEVVLASRRTRRGQLAWGLAKGGIEPDESMEDAAVREVREETGIEAVIEASLGDTKYMYVWEDVRIRKTVHFFLMRATGGDVGDRDDEMEEVRWFPMERALKRAAYRGERDILRRAADILG